MSITRELREYVGNFYLFRYEDVREKLDAIADRIDAEYQKVIRELNNLCDASVLLPVDADGVPWCLGDELLVEGEVCEVVGIGGKTIFYAFGGGVEWTIAHNNRHYHKPTVEDVLLDACKAYHGLMVESMSDVAHDMPAPSEVIAEYAAKLRLAYEGEEQ